MQTATERISHRGPDDEGFYTDPDVALGFRRLAIIDLSPGGHQPMRSADGRFWMVYNGEIYNYLELGQELRQQGVALRSSSDSEVLLEMYARVGKDVVHRLRGMFAFAIWDTWTRELFCARDQFGIKPFYYTIDPGPGPDVGPGRGWGWRRGPGGLVGWRGWPAGLARAVRGSSLVGLVARRGTRGGPPAGRSRGRRGTRRLPVAGTRAARRPGRPRPAGPRIAAADGMRPGGASRPAAQRTAGQACPVMARSGGWPWCARGAGSREMAGMLPGSPAPATCSGSLRNESAWPVRVS